LAALAYEVSEGQRAKGESLQLALIEQDQPGQIVNRAIELPYLPPSKNKYDHWQPAWKSSARKKWIGRLVREIESHQFPKARAVTVKATLVFASDRRRDWQNYVHPLMYWVADSLVHAGVLRDDTPDMFKTMENGGIAFAVDRRRIDPKLRQRTHIVYALET